LGPRVFFHPHANSQREKEATMPVHPDRPIAIYHEHPDWFRPLFT